jgi:hypothetical protein
MPQVEFSSYLRRLAKNERVVRGRSSLRASNWRYPKVPVEDEGDLRLQLGVTAMIPWGY